MSEKILSIIVPVYNCEKFLSRCLDSIISQDFVDFEVIIVNDGSTDNSYRILEDYCNKDNRFLVINQENQGQSIARNIGLSYATGKYIGFVDADDWIEPNMYSVMIEKAILSDADIVVCNHNNIYECDDSVEKMVFNMIDEVINIKSFGVDNYIMDYIRKYKHGNEVWSRIYKRSMLVENNIIFLKNNFKDYPEIAEDLFFNMECTIYAQIIVGVNKGLYNYNIRSGSSMTISKPNLLIRFVKGYNNFFEEYKSFFSSNSFIYLRYNLIRSYYNELFLLYKEERKIKEFNLEWRIAKKDFSYIKESLMRDLSNYSFSQKIYSILIWNNQGEIIRIIREFYNMTKYIYKAKSF